MHIAVELDKLQHSKKTFQVMKLLHYYGFRQPCCSIDDSFLNINKIPNETKVKAIIMWKTAPLCE